MHVDVSHPKLKMHVVLLFHTAVNLLAGNRQTSRRLWPFTPNSLKSIGLKRQQLGSATMKDQIAHK